VAVEAEVEGVLAGRQPQRLATRWVITVRISSAQASMSARMSGSRTAVNDMVS
jgi:hypothetical protein